MKHAREDYNHIQDPSGKIPEDEPVFLLRGQDEIAPKLLVIWANELVERGGDIEMARTVVKHSTKMVSWQQAHTSKLPDMPANDRNIPDGDGGL